MDAFYGTLLAIFAFDGLLIAGLAALYYLPRYRELRLSARPAIKVTNGERVRVGALIGALSLAFVLVPLGAAKAAFVDGDAVGGGRAALEALAILVVYDFAYYAFHRTLHVKRLMRFAHGVHHRARNPSAFESFYMHP
ncbi:MAG: sterol desaturase family protein, partial [Myxococcota bacterium]